MSEPVSQVLLVEDDENHAELIRRAFEPPNHRFRLTVANNLRQARESLSRGQPDIIIADLKLPDGLGIELLPPEDQPQTFPVVC